MREALSQALELNVTIETSETAESREFNAILKRDGRQSRHRMAQRATRESHEQKTPATQFLKKYPDTQLLELLQPDMLGILRGKRVVRDEFAKPFGKGVNFCGATVLLDAKGQTFDRINNGGRDGDPDAISTAVPGSLAPVPWAQVPTGQVLLNMTMNGEPYFADPRNVLRNAAKPLQELGLTAVAATELEFYLLEARCRRADAQGRAHPRDTRKLQDGPQYGIMEDVEDVDPFLAELYAVCAAQNIPVGATLKEFSPGQFEVNLHHVANAELACDHAVLLKRAVKAVAQAPRHGGELHGEAVRGCRGLQPARAREPGRQGGRKRVRGGDALLRYVAPRRRRARGDDGGVDGDLRAHGECLSPLPARAVRAPGADTGDSIIAASRCACRFRAAKTRASSTARAARTAIPTS